MAEHIWRRRRQLHAARAILCKYDADSTLFNVNKSDREVLSSRREVTVDLHNSRLINHWQLITWGGGVGAAFFCMSQLSERDCWCYSLTGKERCFLKSVLASRRSKFHSCLHKSQVTCAPPPIQKNIQHTLETFISLPCLKHLQPWKRTLAYPR